MNSSPDLAFAPAGAPARWWVSGPDGAPAAAAARAPTPPPMDQDAAVRVVWQLSVGGGRDRSGEHCSPKCPPNRQPRSDTFPESHRSPDQERFHPLLFVHPGALGDDQCVVPASSSRLI